MSQGEWVKQGRAWLHPTFTFFVIESEVPEIVAGRSGAMEYQVIRAGGDSSAGFPVATFERVEVALADAERRHLAGS
jgi:hypothetical protein